MLFRFGVLDEEDEDEDRGNRNRRTRGGGGGGGFDGETDVIIMPIPANGFWLSKLGQKVPQ